MAQRDSATVNVHLARIPAKQVTNRQRLRGKSFVGFDEIHLIQRPACPRQRGLAGADGADAHYGRVDPGNGVAHDPAQHR